jgi:hypothetical protein
VDDAIELLTDPAHKAPGNAASAALVRMDGTAILNALLERGAEDDEEARRLVRAGLQRVGGIDRSRLQQPGVRAGGRPRQEMVDDFRVPAAALRR